MLALWEWIRPTLRWLAIGLAAVSLTACGAAELPDDGPQVAISQQAAFSFVTKALTIGESAVEDGQVRFTVTQEEVTSFLNLGAQLMQMAETVPVPGGLEGLEGIESLEQFEGLRQLLPGLDEGSSEGGLLDLQLQLIEPQVYFKSDGRIIVRGEGRLARLRLPARLVVIASATQGELVLDFVEGQLGRAPLPEFLFDPLGDLLARAILAGQDFVEVNEITVTEGSLTVAGRRR